MTVLVVKYFTCLKHTALDRLRVRLNVIRQPCWVFRQPDSVGTALRFTAVLFFLFLATQYSQQSRRRRPSNLYPRFGPRWSFKTQLRDLADPSPNFYRGSKSAKFGMFLTSLNFKAPAFENGAWYLNSETNSVIRDDGRMSSPSLVKFGPRTPENVLPIWDLVKNLTAKMC